MGINDGIVSQYQQRQWLKINVHTPREAGKSRLIKVRNTGIQNM